MTNMSFRNQQHYQGGTLWRNNNNTKNVVTTRNYLTFCPYAQITHAGENKHYSRYRKNSVKLCTVGSKTLWLVAKLPITIKIFDPPNEYIISKNTSGAECLHHSLLSATDEIRQYRNLCIAWTTRLSEPPTVTEQGLLIVLRKHGLQANTKGSFRCGKNCITCRSITDDRTNYTFSATGEIRTIHDYNDCNSKNLIIWYIVYVATNST